MGNVCKGGNHKYINKKDESQGFPYYIQEFIKQVRKQFFQQQSGYQIHRYGKTHIFRGKLIGGKKQGYGEYLINNNGYFGEFLNDQPNGNGILVMDGNNFIRGHFKDGKPHGECRQTINNIQFLGHFQNGQRRKGILKTKSYVYDGEIVNNKFEGIGKLKFEGGQIYQGQFQSGKYHGIGKYVTSNGQYNGHFQNGQYSGKGLYRWKNGEFYEGYYRNGSREGRGRYVKKQFSYEGQFKNGYPIDLDEKDKNLISKQQSPRNSY